MIRVAATLALLAVIALIAVPVQGMHAVESPTQRPNAVCFNNQEECPCAGEFQQCANGGGCTLLPSRCDCTIDEYVCPCQPASCALAFKYCPCIAGSFWDSNLPDSLRVDLIVQNLTLAEASNQLQNSAPAVEHLSIPEYQWLNDDLHGLRRASGTSFPNGNGLGATWSPETLEEVGNTIALEARALHHYYTNIGQRGVGDGYWNGIGMTIYAPNVNLVRDVRWGRSQEVYGEDPLHMSVLAEAYINGMQRPQSGSNVIPAAACVKHLVAYDVENFPTQRYEYNAIVDGRNMFETYLPAFHASVVRSKARHVMCSYNAVNGVPTCASNDLLNGVLRQRWGWDGFVVSDYDAWLNIVVTHHYCANLTCAAAVGINAGMDQEGGGGSVVAQMPAAVAAGFVTEEQVATSAKRLFKVRVELGMFDDPADVPFANISYKTLGSAAHMNLALRAARESVCLYKNKNQVLPLPNVATTRIALVGPNAAATAWLQGNYAVDPRRGVFSIAQGLMDASCITNNASGQQPCTFDAAGVRYNQKNSSWVRASSASQCCDLCNANYGCNYFTFDNGTCFMMGTAAHRTATQDQTVQSGARRGLCLMTYGLDFRSANVNSTSDVVVSQDQFECCQRCRASAKCTRFTFDAVLNLCHLSPNGPNEGRANSFTVSGFSPAKVPNIRFVPACADGMACNEPTGFADAALAAASADVTVVVLGLDQSMESEGKDRHTIELPDNQLKLVSLLRKAAPQKPLIGVFVHGGTFAFGSTIHDLDAIVDAWYPGELGGVAIADVLRGAVNPGGKSPVTFYNSTADLPPTLAQQDLYPNTSASYLGLTYRYYVGPPPVVPFGFGLSYTTFTLSAALETNFRMIAPCDDVVVSVSVTNTGSVAGDEVAQLYVSQPFASVPVPRLRLAAFKRFKNVAPGETRHGLLTVTAQYRAVVPDPPAGSGGRYDPSYVYNATLQVETGAFYIFVGNSQPADLSNPTFVVNVTQSAPLNTCTNF